MNEPFTLLGFELLVWQWIAIAAIVLVAFIIIICIIVWVCKRSKANKRSKEEKSSAEKPAPEPVREEKTVSPAKQEEIKPAAKPEPKPEPKPAAKPEPKPAKEEEKPAVDKGKVYHISKRKEDKKWQIRAEGSTRVLKLFNTQAEAVAYSKQLARNQGARVMVHKEDGSFSKLSF